LGLLGYVLKRLALLGFVLLGVSLVVFLLLRGIPGVDPLAAYIVPGLPMSPEALARLRTELHLDEPLLVQYLYYIADLLRVTGATRAPRRSQSSTPCWDASRPRSSSLSAQSC
jgi:peptide/nickel transport system permease protein